MPYDNEVTMMMSVVPGAMTGISTMMGGLVSINNVFMDVTRQIDASFGLIDAGIVTTSTVVAQFGLQAAQAFGEFEQGLKVAQMVSGQTAQEMDLLRQKANEFSVSYRTDIDQITEGLQTLGRAGLNSATEQTEVLENGLSTAKLEGRDLNGVLEELIQNTALLGGNLKESNFGESSQYVNDLLVATSMTAPITTHDVSETLKYSGGIAAAAGANIESAEGKAILEDYMGAIAAFAQKGVTGSIAGTALRAFFNKPATQDSSVKEALSSIQLKPEYLWEDDEETMKPVSEQIRMIKDQMEDLNISTMDQLQIWSKIVGGKMGQQMMKLDSNDIKELTSDIRAADNATSLAAGTFQTYQSKMKEMTEQGQVAFRQFGEYVAKALTPFLDILKRIFEFFSNPIASFAVFVGAIGLIGQAILKFKNIISALKEELSTIKNYFTQGNELYAMRPSYERFHGRRVTTPNDYLEKHGVNDLKKAVELEKKQSLREDFFEKTYLGPEEYFLYEKSRSWQRNSDRARLETQLHKEVYDENFLSAKTRGELNISPRSINDAWIINEAMKNDLWKPEWTQAFLDPEHFMDRKHFEATVMPEIYRAVQSFYEPPKPRKEGYDEFGNKLSRKRGNILEDTPLPNTKEMVKKMQEENASKPYNPIPPQFVYHIPDTRKDGEKNPNYASLKMLSPERRMNDFIKILKSRDDFIEKFLDKAEEDFGLGYLIKEGAIERTDYKGMALYKSQMQQMFDERHNNEIWKAASILEKKARKASYLNPMDIALMDDDKLRSYISSTASFIHKDDIPKVITAFRQSQGIHNKADLEEYRERYQFSEDFEKQLEETYGWKNSPYRPPVDSRRASDEDLEEEGARLLNERREREGLGARPTPAQAAVVDKKYREYELTLEAHNGFVRKLDEDLKNRINAIKKADAEWDAKRFELESILNITEREKPLQPKDLTNKKSPHYKTIDELKALLDEKGASYGDWTHQTLAKKALPIVDDWMLLEGTEFGKDFNYEEAGLKTLKNISYRELQGYAKLYGIKANQKREVLEKELAKILPEINNDISIARAEEEYTEKIGQQMVENKKERDKEFEEQNPFHKQDGHSVYNMENEERRNKMDEARKSILESAENKMNEKRKEDKKKLYEFNVNNDAGLQESYIQAWDYIFDEQQKEYNEAIDAYTNDSSLNQYGLFLRRKESEKGARPHFKSIPLKSEVVTDPNNPMYNPDLVSLYLNRDTEEGSKEWESFRKSLTEEEWENFKKLRKDVLKRQSIERERELSKENLKKAEEYKKNLSLLPGVNILGKTPGKRGDLLEGEGFYSYEELIEEGAKTKTKDIVDASGVKKTISYQAPQYKDSFLNFSLPNFGISDAATGFIEKLTSGESRQGRLLGYEKANTGLKKFANGALNVADLMGGPLMVAIEAVTMVIELWQQEYQKYTEKLKEAGEQLSKAYSTWNSAENALEQTYRNGNPDATDEEIEQMIYDTYATMGEDMANAANNGSQEWFKKLNLQTEKGEEYEYDEEKDDGSLKKAEEPELTEEEEYANAVKENTGALYFASAELNKALDNYTRQAQDSWWGLDGWTGWVSDEVGGFFDNAAQLKWTTEESGSRFSDNNEFLLTASQADENYAGNREMAGLMMEDFKDAGGDWMTGMRTMMGHDVVEFAKLLPKDTTDYLTNLAQSSANIGKGALTAQQNAKLQASMKNDPKSWKKLGKELAKRDTAQKAGKNIEKQQKRIEGIANKINSTLGNGFKQSHIIEAAYLQQLQDMYQITQQAIVPIMQTNMETAMNTLSVSGQIDNNTLGTGSNTSGTYQNASIIAGLVAIIAKAQAKTVFYDTAVAGSTTPGHITDVNGDTRTDDVDVALIESARKAQNADEWFKQYAREYDEALKINDDDFFISHPEDMDRYGLITSGKNRKRDAQAGGYGYLALYEAAAKMNAYDYDPEAAAQKGREFAEYVTQNGITLADALSTAGKNYQSETFKQKIIDAYNAADLDDEGDGSGGSGSGGNGGSGSGDNKGTKKERVDLVLCNKKEIPKLNVNLFKKPPTFTVLNKNFKVRDVKINTEDKPKAIMSSIKNAFIDVQKRNDPKIVQDEEAEYDPVAATDGDSVPSGNSRTGTN